MTVVPLTSTVSLLKSGTEPPHARKDSRFVVVHCKRCGGFHVGQKRVDNLGNPNNLDTHNPSNSLQHDAIYDLTV